MAEKILIVGGSHSDIPLIQSAKNLGLYVISTGNNPKEKGHLVSDEYIYADFSIKEEILKVSVDKKIKAICSGSNDFAILSASYVAEILQLPGFDSYETSISLHHKNAFKDVASKINLPTPKALIFNKDTFSLKAIKDNLNFPLIVKPVDLTGGKGIVKVDDESKLVLASEFCLKQSRQSNFVVEEFFEGSLHSYSTFISKGIVVFEYFDNEFSYMNPYLVSASTGPALVRDETKLQLKIELEKLAKELVLVDGILHAQFLENKKTFKIVEITRRLPGDFYSKPLKISTGFDQSNAIVECCIGVAPSIPKKVWQKGYVSRHCLMANRNGFYKSVTIAPEMDKFIFEKFNLMNVGEKIENYLVQKTAIYFMNYPNLETMIDFNQRRNDLIQVVVE